MSGSIISMMYGRDEGGVFRGGDKLSSCGGAEPDRRASQRQKPERCAKSGFGRGEEGRLETYGESRQKGSGASWGGKKKSGRS